LSSIASGSACSVPGCRERVAKVKRNVKLALAAVFGATVGAYYTQRRARAPGRGPHPDARAEELRRKLEEAGAAGTGEDDFEVAGMGAETVVAEPVGDGGEEAKASDRGAPEPAAPSEPASRPHDPVGPSERPPSSEFEAMRRRIHEEGRLAAEEMRRSTQSPEEG
jgi:hypothetical protein